MIDFQPPYHQPLEPAVKRNPWRSRSVHPQPVPSFADSRALLPTPVLPARSDWVEMYWRAWELVWLNLHRARPAVGLVSTFLGSGFDNQLDLWGSALGAPFLLYARRALPPLGTLDNFYAQQLDDGYISRAIRLEDGRALFSPFDPNSATLPLLSWAEWRAYRVTGDETRLADVFWPLLGYHRWLRRHRSWPDGLYWTTQLAGSSRSCARVPGGETHHRHWTWVDATLLASLDTMYLGLMAAQLEEGEVANELLTERRVLLHGLDHRLWHEDRGFFLDRGPGGEWSDIHTAAAFWALLDRDLLSPRQLEALVRKLRSETAFAGSRRVPCQALGDPRPEGAGAPALWPGETYAVVRGLRQQGHHALAHDIAVNHLTQVADVFVRTDTFWRYYAGDAAEPGEDSSPGCVVPTALAPIALLIEDVVGITVDWPQRRVTWDQRLPDAVSGVRGLPLGIDHRADLVLQEGQLQVTSDSSFTLQLQDEKGSTQVPISAGTSALDLA